MKHYAKVFISLLIALVTLLVIPSCRSAAANNEGETTAKDQAELGEAMKKDGLNDADIKSAFFYYENGNYRKLVSTSPIIYYGFLEDNSLQIDNIMDYIKLYFINHADEFPITPGFRRETNSSIYYDANKNSISDRNVSSLGASISSDYAGRCLWHFKKNSSGIEQKDKISYFQIELSKRMDLSNNEWKYVVLHELGHGFGLKDVKDTKMINQTVMYYTITGVKIDDSPEYITADARALNLLYGW